MSSAGAMDTIVYTHLCRAMAISYLFTCIVYYSHKKWVKVLFLAIGCMLFGLNIFLWLVFHKIISPQIITLIGETNYTEAWILIYVPTTWQRINITFYPCHHHFHDHIYWEEEEFLQIKNAICFSILSAIILLSSAVGFYHFNVYYQIFKSKTVDDCQIGDIFPFDALTATIYSLNAIRTTNNEMNYAIKVAGSWKRGLYYWERFSSHYINNWRIVHQEPLSSLWLWSTYYAQSQTGGR